MINLKLLKAAKEYLYENEYFIDITPNYTHIYNFAKIETLSSTLITLKFCDFFLKITGQQMSISKAINTEMIIKGKIEGIQYIYE